MLLLGSCAPLTGIYLLQGNESESRTVPTAPPDESPSLAERNAAPGLDDVSALASPSPSAAGRDDTGSPASPSPTGSPTATPSASPAPGA